MYESKVYRVEEGLLSETACAYVFVSYAVLLSFGIKTDLMIDSDEFWHLSSAR